MSEDTPRYTVNRSGVEVQQVTLTTGDLMRITDEAMEQIRRITGSRIDANSVEARLWIAALIIRSLEDVMIGVSTPLESVVRLLKQLRGHATGGSG